MKINRTTKKIRIKKLIPLLKYTIKCNFIVFLFFQRIVKNIKLKNALGFYIKIFLK